jgi:hypothetical protein
MNGATAVICALALSAVAGGGIFRTIIHPPTRQSLTVGRIRP